MIKKEQCVKWLKIKSKGLVNLFVGTTFSPVRCPSFIHYSVTSENILKAHKMKYEIVYTYGNNKKEYKDSDFDKNGILKKVGKKENKVEVKFVEENKVEVKKENKVDIKEEKKVGVKKQEKKVGAKKQDNKQKK